MRPRKKDENNPDGDFPAEEWFAEEDTYFYPKILPLYSFLLRPDGQLFKLLKAKKVQNVKHPVQYGCFLCKRWLQPDQVDNHLAGKTHLGCIKQIQHTYELITVEHEWYEAIFYHMTKRAPPVSFMASAQRRPFPPLSICPYLRPLLTWVPPVKIEDASEASSISALTLPVPSPVPAPMPSPVPAPMMSGPPVPQQQSSFRHSSAQHVIRGSPVRHMTDPNKANISGVVLPKPVSAMASGRVLDTTGGNQLENSAKVDRQVKTKTADLFVKDKEANIQRFFNKCRDQAFIGLEYVVEIQAEELNYSDWYSCRLCDTLYNPKGENTPCLDNMRQHLTMNSHKIKYLSRHFPTIYEYKLKTPSSQAVMQISETVERCFGRLKVNLVKGRKMYRERLEEINVLIEQGPHFREDQNIVDIVMMKKPQHKTHALDKKTCQQHKEDHRNPIGLDVGNMSPVSSTASLEDLAEDQVLELKTETFKTTAPSNKNEHDPENPECSTKTSNISLKLDITNIEKKEENLDKKYKIDKVKLEAKDQDPEEIQIKICKKEPEEIVEVTKVVSKNTVKQQDNSKYTNGTEVSELPLAVRREMYRKEREQRVRQFKEDEKAMVAAMDKQKDSYMDDPSKHPDYSKQWSIFWRSKTADLRSRGLRESDYDMKPEWIVQWTEYFETNLVERKNKARESLMRKHKLLTRDLVEFENQTKHPTQLVQPTQPPADDVLSLSSNSDQESCTKQYPLSPDINPTMLKRLSGDIKSRIQVDPMSSRSTVEKTSNRGFVEKNLPISKPGSDRVLSRVSPYTSPPRRRSPERSASPWEEEDFPSFRPAVQVKRSRSPRRLSIEREYKRKPEDKKYAREESSHTTEFSSDYRRQYSPSYGQSRQSPDHRGSNHSPSQRNKGYSPIMDERWHSPSRSRQWSPIKHNREYTEKWNRVRTPDRIHSADKRSRSPMVQRCGDIDLRKPFRTEEPPSERRSPLSQRSRFNDFDPTHSQRLLSPFSERRRFANESFDEMPEEVPSRANRYPDRRSDELSQEVSVIATLRLMSALDQAGIIRDLGKQIDEELGKAVVEENRSQGSSADLLNDKSCYKLFLATKERVQTLIRSSSVNESEGKVCRIILDNVIILMQRSSLVPKDVEDPSEVVYDDQRLIKMAIARTIDQQLTAEGRRLNQQEFNALVEAEYIRVKHQIPSQIVQNSITPTVYQEPIVKDIPFRSSLPAFIPSYNDVPNPNCIEVPSPGASRIPNVPSPFPQWNNMHAQAEERPFEDRVSGQDSKQAPPVVIPNMVPKSHTQPSSLINSLVPAVVMPVNPPPSASASLDIDWNSLSNIIKTVKETVPVQSQRPLMSQTGSASGMSRKALSITQDEDMSVDPYAEDPPVAEDEMEEEEEFYADFTDEELISLLRNFKTLEPLEQKDLISHMKKLERDEPQRVMKLKEAMHQR